MYSCADKTCLHKPAAQRPPVFIYNLVQTGLTDKILCLEEIITLVDS